MFGLFVEQSYKLGPWRTPAFSKTNRNAPQNEIHNLSYFDVRWCSVDVELLDKLKRAKRLEYVRKWLFLLYLVYKDDFAGA